MIASFANNFVFVKSRKTAGTSVELVLSGWCGPEDILTPLMWEDELARHKLGFSPRGYCADPTIESDICKAIARTDSGNAMRSYLAAAQSGGLKFWNHISAEAICRRLPAFWQSAFKFTIERHPYEKVVSLAFFLLRDVDDYVIDDVRRLISLIVPRGEYRNDTIYRIDGVSAVDLVIDFDTLWPTMSDLAARFNKPFPDDLPRAKGKCRRFANPAADLLTASQKREVQKICAWEFATYRYKP